MATTTAEHLGDDATKLDKASGQRPASANLRRLPQGALRPGDAGAKLLWVEPDPCAVKSGAPKPGLGVSKSAASFQSPVLEEKADGCRGDVADALQLLHGELASVKEAVRHLREEYRGQGRPPVDLSPVIDELRKFKETSRREQPPVHETLQELRQNVIEVREAQTGLLQELEAVRTAQAGKDGRASEVESLLGQMQERLKEVVCFQASVALKMSSADGSNTITHMEQCRRELAALRAELDGQFHRVVQEVQGSLVTSTEHQALVLSEVRDDVKATMGGVQGLQSESARAMRDLGASVLSRSSAQDVQQLQAKLAGVDAVQRDVHQLHTKLASMDAVHRDVQAIKPLVHQNQEALMAAQELNHSVMDAVKRIAPSEVVAEVRDEVRASLSNAQGFQKQLAKALQDLNANILTRSTAEEVEQAFVQLAKVVQDLNANILTRSTSDEVQQACGQLAKDLNANVLTRSTSEEVQQAFAQLADLCGRCNASELLKELQILPEVREEVRASQSNAQSFQKQLAKAVQDLNTNILTRSSSAEVQQRFSQLEDANAKCDFNALLKEVQEIKPFLGEDNKVLVEMKDEVKATQSNVRNFQKQLVKVLQDLNTNILSRSSAPEVQEILAQLGVLHEQRDLTELAREVHDIKPAVQQHTKELLAAVQDRQVMSELVKISTRCDSLLNALQEVKPFVHQELNQHQLALASAVHDARLGILDANSRLAHADALEDLRAIVLNRSSSQDVHRVLEEVGRMGARLDLSEVLKAIHEIKPALQEVKETRLEVPPWPSQDLLAAAQVAQQGILDAISKIVPADSPPGRNQSELVACVQQAVEDMGRIILDRNATQLEQVLAEIAGVSARCEDSLLGQREVVLAFQEAQQDMLASMGQSGRNDDFVLGHREVMAAVHSGQQGLLEAIGRVGHADAVLVSEQREVLAAVAAVQQLLLDAAAARRPQHSEAEGALVEVRDGVQAVRQQLEDFHQELSKSLQISEVDRSTADTSVIVGEIRAVKQSIMDSQAMELERSRTLEDASALNRCSLQEELHKVLELLRQMGARRDAEGLLRAVEEAKEAGLAGQAQLLEALRQSQSQAVPAALLSNQTEVMLGIQQALQSILDGLGGAGHGEVLGAIKEMHQKLLDAIQGTQSVEAA